MKAEVYSKDNCPYCVKAKKLLESRGIEYVEVNAVEHREALIERVTQDTGKAPRSVPQIYLDGAYIGGYDDLVKYFKAVDMVAADHVEVIEGMTVTITKDAIEIAEKRGIDLVSETRKAVIDDIATERRWPDND